MNGGRLRRLIIIGVAAALTAGCGSHLRLDSASSETAARETAVTSGADERGPSTVLEPIDPGPPVLIEDLLLQPLGDGGRPVNDVAAFAFEPMIPSNLGTPSRLVTYDDYSLLAIVLDASMFGPLIIKEGISDAPTDIEGILAAVDDPSTPELTGVDPRSGSTYVGVLTTYGTALVEYGSGWSTVYFVDGSRFVEIRGLDGSLDGPTAVKLATDIRFS